MYVKRIFQGCELQSTGIHLCKTECLQTANGGLLHVAVGMQGEDTRQRGVWCVSGKGK